MYGAYHQNRLAKREVGIREVEAEQKKIRDAKLAIEKKRLVEGKNDFKKMKNTKFECDINRELVSNFSEENAAIAAL